MTLGPLSIVGFGLACFLAHLRSTTGSFVGWFEKLKASCLGWLVLATYMIYPSVSTTLFQTLRCEVFPAPEAEEDERVVAYLRADLRLECGHGDLADFQSGHGFHWDAQYTTMWWYSMFFVLVFPIGECGAPAECDSFNIYIEWPVPPRRHSRALLHPALHEPGQNSTGQEF